MNTIALVNGDVIVFVIHPIVNFVGKYLQNRILMLEWLAETTTLSVSTDKDTEMGFNRSRMRVNPRNGSKKRLKGTLEGRNVPNLQQAIAKTDAVLMAHAGATMISRGDLKNVETPKGTSSWKPVSHSLLVDCIENTLKRADFNITKEEYAVQTEGAKLFGVMTLNHAHSDYALALGIRTSNDKSFPVQMIAGARVFVCDNMAFSGEVVTLKRRHTSGLDIRQEVAGGIQRAIAQFTSMETAVEKMKAISLIGRDVAAKAKILDAAVKGVMPLRLIPEVYGNYFEPKHEEFQERNAWSLHNAFTEAFKGLKPNVAMQSGIELGRLFNV